MQFDAVVLARGFGTERCWVEDHLHGPPSRFEGIPFWGNDTFEAPTMGLPTPAPGRSPQIPCFRRRRWRSPDFLRLVTGLRSAEQVVLQIAMRVPNWNKIFEGVGALIQPEEDQAQRALMWSEPGELDHPILERLHRLHVDAVETIANSASWPEISAALDSIVGSRNVFGVVLSHSCTHFAPSYALNRFLALLVGWWLQSKRGDRPLVLRSGERLVRVSDPQGHVCVAGCWGIPHLATTIQHSCISAALVTTPPAPSHWLCDGLVIRHGIETHALKMVEPRRVLRQSPPFHHP